jgi:hypothetical protein
MGQRSDITRRGNSQGNVPGVLLGALAGRRLVAGAAHGCAEAHIDAATRTLLEQRVFDWLDETLSSLGLQTG